MTTETTNYQKQALEFLANTETTFKATFLKSGKHFEDDKEVRDIYTIELSRKNRKYTFNFGQSINNSGFYYTKGKLKTPIDRSQLETKNIKTYIKKKDWSFMGNGTSDTIHYPVTPTPYDVLACLTKNNPGTFEDFCNEFGYDTDSRKAENTYKAVKEEYLQVSRLYNEQELDLMAEIA